jgi:hypothetical protein
MRVTAIVAQAPLGEATVDSVTGVGNSTGTKSTLTLLPFMERSELSSSRMTTLAKRLGTTEHHSLLLRKAREAGLYGASELIGLAIARGCLHYQGGPEPVPAVPLAPAAFSDEELAIALLSPCLPYSLRAIRAGAQMLGSRGSQPRRLALLACQERAENVVRHIAVAGRQTEPQEPFWVELLGALPPASPLVSAIPPGVLPHPSRFRIETGITDPSNPVTRGGPRMTWLRPSPSAIESA